MIRELKHQPDGSDGGEEDYLSRLANSILKKETREPTGVPPGGISQSMLPKRPSNIPPFRGDSPEALQTGPMMTPLPTSPRSSSGNHMTSHVFGNPSSTMNTPQPISKTPLASHTPRPGNDSSSGIHRLPGEWIRKVDFFDANGDLLPGTILVFEDGMMGVFKEKNLRKDYDIVYLLDGRGRATPQGIPLYNYSVEPVGRLSQTCLDSIVAHSRWDRDMIVFHLLRYRDRVYVPVIQENAHDVEPIANSENLSQMTVQKLTPEMLHSEYKAEEAEKPALTRGREMTIEFGPGRKWKAVYWGKDELGHVVAHNTHDIWSLMHLDLNRFKDCIVFGNIVDAGTVRDMERDLTKA